MGRRNRGGDQARHDVSPTSAVARRSRASCGATLLKWSKCRLVCIRERLRSPTDPRPATYPANLGRCTQSPEIFAYLERLHEAHKTSHVNFWTPIFRVNAPKLRNCAVILDAALLTWTCRLETSSLATDKLRSAVGYYCGSVPQKNWIAEVVKHPVILMTARKLAGAACVSKWMPVVFLSYILPHFKSCWPKKSHRDPSKRHKTFVPAKQISVQIRQK